MFMYVKKEEFTCKCGCGHNNVNEDFLWKINHARHLAGVPFKINSGCRCEKHNKNEGGSLTSAHLVGLAADIETKDSRTRYKVVRALLMVGFDRIGIGKNFVHVDAANCEIKPDEVMWDYYKE